MTDHVFQFAGQTASCSCGKYQSSYNPQADEAVARLFWRRHVNASGPRRDGERPRPLDYWTGEHYRVVSLAGPRERFVALLEDIDTGVTIAQFYSLAAAVKVARTLEDGPAFRAACVALVALEGGRAPKDEPCSYCTEPKDHKRTPHCPVFLARVALEASNDTNRRTGEALPAASRAPGSTTASDGPPSAGTERTKP